ncbi:hypothetical protein M0638_19050 [Roseomonas sp. NAR14]|uniref:Uncharacterized protein n=1 Tax=Roseomonas acroporae TaxID=2937791 RepID=A0A9X2BVA7_9PROT|nr:hypothetical protein [Roseomonas acroporae]MCK8786478.1 hypothetical protein [Roseomonas acroporae]
MGSDKPGFAFDAAGIRAWMDRQRAEREAELREAARQRRQEQRALHRAFRERQVPPDALERLQTLVRRTAQRGEREVLVLRFPSDWMHDSGRSITSGQPDWHDKLDGFAARAYEFYRRELQPRGFDLRPVIMDYPDGKPGDVGIYLSWKTATD